MLKELHISNYVLIDDLHLSPAKDINIITGETGAGKSIMLGAISLLTGTRADTKTLLNDSKKCFIEGTFSKFSTSIIPILESNEIDNDDELIIRREINPSGKSRAFVNDTPVRLEVLKELAPLLLDVHSQHQTLLLKNPLFQLNIIDGFANTTDQVTQFKKEYLVYTNAIKELQQLIEIQSSANQELDYNSFLYKELKEAQLNPQEDNSIEEDLAKIENTEQIKTILIQCQQIYNEEQYGVISGLQNILSSYKNLVEFGKEYNSVNERINALLIEAQDLASEIENQNETLLYDHEKAFELKGRVDIINKLLLKHSVSTSEDLLLIQEELETKLEQTESLEDSIKQLEIDISKMELTLLALAKEISIKRKESSTTIQSETKLLLADLGMENAELTIEQITSDVLNPNGIDEIQFLFSANKGSKPSPIHQVASGGEFSRLMFTLKYLSASHSSLPTIIFDEIDTGISGEVALKMSHLMDKMSKNHQLLVITHLPQIASKGLKHFYVYKDHSSEKTISHIKQLSKEERISEIGQMLSGNDVSDSARNIAKELLGFA